MRLRTIAFIDGRAVRVDEGPSYARLPGHSGSLVVAPSRPVKAHLTKNQTAPARAAAYERTKRYRERLRGAA